MENSNIRNFKLKIKEIDSVNEFYITILNRFKIKRSHIKDNSEFYKIIKKYLDRNNDKMFIGLVNKDELFKRIYSNTLKNIAYIPLNYPIGGSNMECTGIYDKDYEKKQHLKAEKITKKIFNEIIEEFNIINKFENFKIESTK